MRKCILFVISFVLYLSGFTQGTCYNCLDFHGDSVSIDSSLTLRRSYFFPAVTDTVQFSNLDDGLWASLTNFSKEVEFILEIEGGRINGRVVRIPFGLYQQDLNSIVSFEEYHFIDGKANGKYIKWSDYSLKRIDSEGFYSNNLKDSVWLSYYAEFANFALFQEERYKNNRLNGVQREWHPNGKLMSEKQCVNDRYIGEATEYYATGQKYRDVLYLGGSSPFAENYKYVNVFDRNGAPLVVNGTGIHKLFDEKGEIWKTGPIENGLRHGVWTIYPNGILKSTEIYEHGVLVRGK